MNIKRQGKYIFSDVVNNNNKFWNFFWYENDVVKVEWGRVGESTQTKEHPHSNPVEAEKFVKKKITEKTRKGYSEAKVVGGEINNVSPSSGKTISKDSVRRVAKEQIKSDSSEVEKLIDYLIGVNIHDIVHNTGGVDVQYDEKTGLFKTPLGIVTLDGITQARDILDDISEFVAKDDRTNSIYHGLLSQYLRVIPQKTSRRIDAVNLFTSVTDIQNQSSILDSLESSYNAMLKDQSDITKDKPTVVEDKVFDVNLNLVSDDSVISEISRRYHSTLSRSHSCSHLKVKKVFKVDISSMKKQFIERGFPIGNVMTLWHGTKASNLLSILKSGLVIPPSRSKHVTGRLYSDGLYFSDISTKSLNYSYGYWGGSGPRDNNCFMFVCDVAMGKSYTPVSTNESFPKPGFDSTFAKAGRSGVINNEMIVYNVFQANLKYLVEFFG